MRKRFCGSPGVPRAGFGGTEHPGASDVTRAQTPSIRSLDDTAGTALRTVLPVDQGIARCWCLAPEIDKADDS